MSSVLFRGCASLILGGLTIGAPAYLYTKWNGSSSISNTLTKSQSITPARTNPSQAPTKKEKEFYNCLDGNNHFEVTDKRNKHKKIISSVSEIGKHYLDDSIWEVKPLYDGQCQKYNQQ